MFIPSFTFSFRRFPKDEDVRKEWEVPLRRERLTASGSSVLCSATCPGRTQLHLEWSPVKAREYQGIEDFAVEVGTLVGMLSTLQGPSTSKMVCGSQVDTLFLKLPVNFRDSFAEYCFSRGIMKSGSDATYILPDLAEWLERKVQTRQITCRISVCSPDITHVDSRERRAEKQLRVKSATILLITTRGLRNLIYPSHQALHHSLRSVPGFLPLLQ